MREPRGLLCEARFMGAKFREWEGKDKQNPGRQKLFRTLTYRFEWDTENGAECLNTVEWLPDNSPAHSLKDCSVPFKIGVGYNLTLRGLKEEGGILQAQSKSIVPMIEDSVSSKK